MLAQPYLADTVGLFGICLMIWLHFKPLQRNARADILLHVVDASDEAFSLKYSIAVPRCVDGTCTIEIPTFVVNKIDNMEDQHPRIERDE